MLTNHTGTSMLCDTVEEVASNILKVSNDNIVPKQTDEEATDDTTKMQQHVEEQIMKESHDTESTKEVTENFMILPDAMQKRVDIEKEVTVTLATFSNVANVQDNSNTLVTNCSLSQTDDNDDSSILKKRVRDEEDTETDDDSDSEREDDTKVEDKSSLQEAVRLVEICQNNLDKEEMKYKLATKQMRKMIGDAKQCLKACMVEEGLTTIDINSQLKFTCKEKSNGVKCWNVIKSTKRQKVIIV
jgi:hypothetical protein